jgi:hypothetical protein
MNTKVETESGAVVAEFRSSRPKALLVAGGCAAVAALFAAAALIEPSLWPWLGTAYFGAGAVLIALNGLYRPAMLRLDAQGVDFIHWRYRWSLTWGDIAEVQLVVLRINWSRVKANVVLLDRAGTKHTISSGLTITPDKLADLIRSRSHLAPAEPSTAKR